MGSAATSWLRLPERFPPSRCALSSFFQRGHPAFRSGSPQDPLRARVLDGGCAGQNLRYKRATHSLKRPRPSPERARCQSCAHGRCAIVARSPTALRQNCGAAARWVPAHGPSGQIVAQRAPQALSQVSTSAAQRRRGLRPWSRQALPYHAEALAPGLAGRCIALPSSYKLPSCPTRHPHSGAQIGGGHGEAQGMDEATESLCGPHKTQVQGPHHGATRGLSDHASGRQWPPQRE